MKAYIYAADCFCEACGEAIRQRLTQEGKAPADPENEHTYDSDQFPKGPYDDAGGESDTVHHCGSGEKCLEPTVIAGENYGKFLENPLTQAGIQYLKDSLEEDPDSEVVKFWVDFYRRDGYTI